MASCFSSVLNMHAVCPLAPLVILAHCADFSAFLLAMLMSPNIRTKRPVLACFVGAALSACDGGVH